MPGSVLDVRGGLAARLAAARERTDRFFALFTPHGLYERAIPEDLIRNAIVVATFAYQAANRDAMFPRKPLPKPRPATPVPGAAPQRPVTTTSQR